MKKEELRKKQKIVDPLVNKWRKWLLLNEWHYDIDFAEEDDDGTIATIDVNEVYLKARITFYPVFFTRSKEKQERTVIHELCHCLTEKVWNMMDQQHNGYLHHKLQQKDAIETLTQRICNAVYMVAKNY